MATLRGKWVVQRQTEKAILFAQDTGKKLMVWIPKKVLFGVYDKEAVTESLYDIELPEWFTVKYIEQKKNKSSSGKGNKKKPQNNVDNEWTEERKRIRDEAIAKWARTKY